MESLKATISEIQEGFYTRIPYITGTVPLKATHSKLFYATDELSGSVDFSKATQPDLELLVKACQPATFGLKQETVYDESYRKALKMDSSNFSVHFNPIELGIEDIVKQKLVQKDEDPIIRFELYKLNVYGPSSFFKSHVDTPRGQSMFGSLVIVLPTVHEGGSLLFRHNAQQWEFDSAAVVSVDSCTAAFTAFFSDVEHEVTPIISGYRATITYNLYFGTATDPAPAAKTHVSTRLREQFKKLLKNPCFLPEGGYIGVHLLHKYPFDSRDRYVKLKDFEKYLKGVDGDILTLFREFRLDANLKMLYKEQDGRGHCLANTIIDFDELENDAHWAKEEKALPIERYIYGEWEAQAIISASEDGRWDGMESDEGNQRKYSPIFWLRGDIDVRPNHKERCYTYTAGGQYLYGNEADWSVYQELALVAWLGPVHQRETYVPKSPSK